MTEDRKNFIVYKASAGSGKTFTLVQEYLALCLRSESRFYFSRILAITFTNKAAAEMKERILQHLKLLSLSPDHKDYRKDIVDSYLTRTNLTEKILIQRAQSILEAILHQYTSLSVSTIDKFTHKLIRSFARDLKLASDFNIETDTDIPLEKSVDEIISLAGKDGDITVILEKYIEFLTENGDNWAITKGIKIFGRQLFAEDAAEHIAKLKKLSVAEFSELFTGLNKKIKDTEAGWMRIAENFQKLQENSSLSDSHFKGGRNGLHRHIRYVLQKDFLSKSFPFTETDIVKLNTGDLFSPAGLSQLPAPVQTEIPMLLQQLHNSISSLLPSYAFYRLLQKNMYHLALIEKLNTKINEIKQIENTVMIGEFNRIISDIIQFDPAPFIYERIGEKYKHILIDEFQDTSRLQFVNLLPLIENALSAGNQCLLVGDPKQAIYRWRNGDVDQFIQLPAIDAEVRNEIKETILYQYKADELDLNRRSGKFIVDFNNHFFSEAASSLNEKYRNIYASLRQKSVKENGYVELILIDDQLPDAYEKVFEKTVLKIEECLKDQFNLKDITLLIRSNREGAALASYLYEKNIPVISKDSLLLNSSPEVQLVMNFICWLAQPFHPSAGFKIIELHQYVNGKADEKVLLQYQSPYQKNSFDVAGYFKDYQIEFNRARFLNSTSYHLIEASIKLFFPGKNSIYLRFLTEYVFNNWKNKPVDAAELHEWWEENKDALSIRSSENEHAVQIMTIHASKGLQFPVVIFPFADWRQKNGKEWVWIDFSDENMNVETALVKSNASLLDSTEFQNIKTEEQNKSILDDLNLLYVAFTRPEERLYIIGRNKDILKKYLPDFEKVLEKSDSNPEILSIGIPAKAISRSEKQPEFLHLSLSRSDSWDERLRLSLSQHKNTQDQESEYYSKISGIVLHSVFESASNTEEALEILQNKIKSEALLSGYEKKLSNEIIHTFNHPEISNWMKSHSALNECTVVDADGHSFRPDRVFKDGEGVIVLDFKTGVKKASHMEQVKKYGELFARMNYNPVKLYLFYTRDAELIQV